MFDGNLNEPKWKTGIDGVHCFQNTCTCKLSCPLEVLEFVQTTHKTINWDVELHIKFSRSCSYSSRLFSSKCFTMAASILLVRVTRGVFDDEDEGGLERMATIPLLPNVE